MGYYIDISAISILAYREKLKTAYLPPSRMVLKENLEKRFEYFEKEGLKNVQDLLFFLKKKGNIERLDSEGHVDKEYLKILLRELNSMRPKPNLLKDFAGISVQATTALGKMGVKNTAQLFEYIKTHELRKNLAEAAGLNINEVEVLAKLTDISRIKWAGAIFSRMLLDAGFDGVKKIAGADPDILHEKINQINKEKNYYKGHIGLNDIRIFIEVAKDLPLDIEFNDRG